MLKNQQTEVEGSNEFSSSGSTADTFTDIFIGT
jgi:hypothetical protein